jgi:hypothetical protein
MTVTLQGGFVMKNEKKRMLPILVSTAAIVALAMTPALAKDSKSKKSNQSSAESIAQVVGHAPEQNNSPMAVHQDSKPGPAWRTVGGTLNKVKATATRSKTTTAIKSCYASGKARSTSTRKRSGTLSARKLPEAASRIPFSKFYFESAHPPHARRCP